MLVDTRCTYVVLLIFSAIFLLSTWTRKTHFVYTLSLWNNLLIKSSLFYSVIRKYVPHQCKSGTAIHPTEQNKWSGAQNFSKTLGWLSKYWIDTLLRWILGTCQTNYRLKSTGYGEVHNYLQGVYPFWCNKQPANLLINKLIYLYSWRAFFCHGNSTCNVVEQLDQLITG